MTVWICSRNRTDARRAQGFTRRFYLYNNSRRGASVRPRRLSTRSKIHLGDGSTRRRRPTLNLDRTAVIVRTRAACDSGRCPRHVYAVYSRSNNGYYARTSRIIRCTYAVYNACIKLLCGRTALLDTTTTARTPTCAIRAHAGSVKTK